MEQPDEKPATVILVSGSPVPAGIVDVPPGSKVIAADGGFAQARRLGLHVDLLVGDMDSITPEAFDAARESGSTIRIHPVDKDATDLELALTEALDDEPGEIIVIGGGGGRFDHFIGNAMVIASRAASGRRISWWTGSEMATVAVPGAPARLAGRKGDWLSLIPVGGSATGVVVRGTKWELDGSTLEVGSTRAISNVLTEPEVTVSIESGTLLVIHTSGDAG